MSLSSGTSFLDLSAELRNDSLALEDKNNFPSKGRVYHGTVADFEKWLASKPQKDPNRPLAWSSKMPNLSLTQVCRQIRTEFRPLYMTSDTVKISGSNLTAYLGIFLPGWDAGTIPADLVANIIVTKIGTWVRGSADVLQLLRLAAFAPSVKLQIDDRACPASYGLHDLFSTQPEQWRDIFTRGLILDSSLYTLDDMTMDACLELQILLKKKGENQDEIQAARAMLEKRGFHDNAGCRDEDESRGLYNGEWIDLEEMGEAYLYLCDLGRVLDMNSHLYEDAVISLFEHS